MDRRLINFLNTRMQQHPAIKMPAAEFVEMFHCFLGPETEKDFPRGRILAELTAAGFAVGMGEKTYYVGGVAPRGEYKVDNGKLVLAAARANVGLRPRDDYATR